MSASFWPLQVAVYEELTSNTGLMSLITGVFDSVEQDYVSFPYVTIGENIQAPFDTDDSVGDSNVFAIHVWSRESGKNEAYVLNGLIYDILNRNMLYVPGYATIDIIAEAGSTVSLDPDGKTYHGINNFRATLTKALGD